MKGAQLSAHATGHAVPNLAAIASPWIPRFLQDGSKTVFGITDQLALNMLLENVSGAARRRLRRGGRGAERCVTSRCVVARRACAHLHPSLRIPPPPPPPPPHTHTHTTRPPSREASGGWMPTRWTTVQRSCATARCASTPCPCCCLQTPTSRLCSACPGGGWVGVCVGGGAHGSSAAGTAVQLLPSWGAIDRATASQAALPTARRPCACRHGVQPYVVHATFQRFSTGVSRYGERGRFRQFGMW